MDEYSALAQRISVSVREVRGCLVLSRDGLVLGAYPDEDESLAKSAWLRFAALGEPDRSFVEFADQVWAYVKRGPYAAFAVAEAGVRPGIMVDQLEQVLLEAEAGRTKRDTLKVPDAASAPSGKPRTSLHPPADRPMPNEVGAAEPHDRRAFAEGIGPRAAAAPPAGAPSPGGPPAEVPPAAAPPAEVPAAIAPAPEPPQAAEPAAAGGEPQPSALGRKPQKLVSSGGGGGEDDDSEVDRVMLAKEFSGLLQVDEADDDGNS
jgi:hypothetical protein